VARRTVELHVDEPVLVVVEPLADIVAPEPRSQQDRGVLDPVAGQDDGPGVERRSLAAGVDDLDPRDLVGVGAQARRDGALTQRQPGVVEQTLVAGRVEHRVARIHRAQPAGG